MDKDKMDKDKIDKETMKNSKEVLEKLKKANKYNKHNKLESYNFLKSVKDKEKTVLNYYKRINSGQQSKPLPKPKKLTRKNLTIKYDSKDNSKDNNKDDETENMKEKDNKREKPKTKIAPRGEEPKKYVIMD